MEAQINSKNNSHGPSGMRFYIRLRRIWESTAVWNLNLCKNDGLKHLESAQQAIQIS